MKKVQRRKNSIMIFLYFFIAIGIIVGIYFAVELGVKYWGEKKTNNQLNIGNDPTVNQVNGYPLDETPTKIFSAGDTRSPDDDNVDNLASLNRETLIAELRDILIMISLQKQFQQVDLYFAQLLKSKRKHLRERKKKRKTIKYLWDSDLNIGLSYLDMEIRLFELYLNYYSDELFRKCKQHESVSTRLRYSIDVSPQNMLPQKT